MDGSVKKNIKINTSRKHAKSDVELKIKRQHKCAECNSKNTILIYFDDNSYVSNDGTGCKDSQREYLCLDCRKYTTITILGHYRKFYTRFSD